MKTINTLSLIWCLAILVIAAHLSKAHAQDNATLIKWCEHQAITQMSLSPQVAVLKHHLATGNPDQQAAASAALHRLYAQARLQGHAEAQRRIEERNAVIVDHVLRTEEARVLGESIGRQLYIYRP